MFASHSVLVGILNRVALSTTRRFAVPRPVPVSFVAAIGLVSTARTAPVDNQPATPRGVNRGNFVISRMYFEHERFVNEATARGDSIIGLEALLALVIDSGRLFRG